jgi:hypothetical protein
MVSLISVLARKTKCDGITPSWFVPLIIFTPQFSFLPASIVRAAPAGVCRVTITIMRRPIFPRLGKGLFERRLRSQELLPHSLLRLPRPLPMAGLWVKRLLVLPMDQHMAMAAL